MIIVFGGLYWGPHTLGNCHFLPTEYRSAGMAWLQQMLSVERRTGSRGL